MSYDSTYIWRDPLQLRLQDRWWAQAPSDPMDCEQHCPPRRRFDLTPPKRTLAYHHTMAQCTCYIGQEWHLRQWLEGLAIGDEVLVVHPQGEPDIGTVTRVIKEGVFLQDGVEQPLPVLALDNKAFFDCRGSQVNGKDVIRPLEEGDAKALRHRDLAHEIGRVSFKHLSYQKLRDIKAILDQT